MTPHAAAALIVFSAFLHAGWNALLHRSGPRAPQATLLVLILSLMLSVTAAAATSWMQFLQAYRSGWVLLSGVSEALYFLTLGVALQRLPLGLGYLIMRGVSMLLVTSLSVAFLHESMGGIKALGMASIACGVLLRGLFSGKAQTKPDVAAPVRPSPSGLAAAFGAAAGIAGYHMAYGRALAQGTAALPLFAASLTIAVCLNVLWLGPRAIGQAYGACRGEMPFLLAAACTCLAAFWLFLCCLGAIPAGSAICLRNLSVVFAQGLGWAMGERMTPRAVVAIAFFALGASLLVAAP